MVPAPECCFVELVRNGEPAGVYVKVAAFDEDGQAFVVSPQGLVGIHHGSPVSLYAGFSASEVSGPGWVFGDFVVVPDPTMLELGPGGVPWFAVLALESSD